MISISFVLFNTVDKVCEASYDNSITRCCFLSVLEWTGLLDWTTHSRLTTPLCPIITQTVKTHNGLCASLITKLKMARSV